jgi:hypothetical protein
MRLYAWGSRAGDLVDDNIVRISKRYTRREQCRVGAHEATQAIRMPSSKGEVLADSGENQGPAVRRVFSPR